MKADFESLSDSQKEVIIELDSAMKNLFDVFVKVDEREIPISDAFDIIGVDIPLLLKPAVNQLSGKLKKMRKEAPVEPTAEIA